MSSDTSLEKVTLEFKQAYDWVTGQKKGSQSLLRVVWQGKMAGQVWLTLLA